MSKIQESAKKTIKLEADSINHLLDLIDDNIDKAVELILQSKGRVVLAGIGKSANIAQKIVATLNSTGTPAVFMHAADAIHGDLGNVQKDDVVICLSKSGNTPEIVALIPIVKSMGNQVVAITANTESKLGLASDVVLNTYVEKEACPNNLAPTTSTTAQLVMGDALAVCLMEARGFSSENFAQYHPGGALGKKLYLTVKDIIAKNEVPKVQVNAALKATIVEISSKRLGATAVLDQEKVVGVVTDGDIRRMLEKHDQVFELKAEDIMTKNPKTITETQLASEAFNALERSNITQLIVLDESGNYKGIIHLHDLIKEGIF